MLLSLSSFGTWLRNRNLLDAELPSQFFVFRREQTRVASQQARPVPEAFSVAVQDRRQQLVIRRIAESNHLPITDESTFHFGVVDFVAEFCLPWPRFAPPNNLSMGFKEADHFRLGGQGFLIENPTNGLVYHLFH